MSNKRNIGMIFGVAAATVLASGGSIFLTNTGLTLIDKSVTTVQEAESGLTAKETELPMTVEQFAKTGDSFDILIDGKVSAEGETETQDQNETEKKETEKKETEKKETEASSNTPETESTAVTEEDTSILYASGNLNIRTGAGTDSDVLGTFAPGDQVTVLGDAGDGWTKVSYQGQTGYVSSNYLTQNKSETTQGSTGSSSGSSSTGSSSTGSSSTGQVMYATDYVYVRSDDDKKSSTLGGLSTGEAVSVVGNTGTGWIQVNYNGQTGYVGEHYLSWSQNSSSSGSNSSSSSSSGSGAWDDSFMMYDIDSRYISADELSGWSSSDLAILRNEIFARHGRIFSTPSWAEYFSQKTWYVPTYDPSYFDSNMRSFLNDCEWANLQVILAVEG